MSNIQHIAGFVFIILGLGFDVIGCIGLLRFRDTCGRLQATIKCVTFGTCAILIGTFILKGFCSTGMKAILTVVFLLLTSPVSAHALARAVYKPDGKI
ncbi:MAG: monovalent cation/H(+) antiporter subunit G [Candidatus Omnitrophota bacterium]|jgi:multicomponent Na+:H+ antiporter subunit G